MIRFIENIGDYFSQHFFNEDFPKKVFDKAGYITQKKDEEGQDIDNHVSFINSKVAPLREKYFKFKNEYLSIQRTKDRVKLTHDFHNEILKTLNYKNGIQEYESPVYLNDKEEVIPVRYQYFKGDKPYLYIMEMKAMIKEGDKEIEGIYNQIYVKEEWEKVFPEEWKDIQVKPDIINEALTELFVLPEDERPEYLIMLAAPKIFLIQYEKWKYDSFLLFDLEELFTESQVPANRNYLSLFYALLSKSQFISETESILHSLEEDAHKSMFGVTQALKNSVVHAVENLANEAIHYKLNCARNQEEKREIEALMANDTFARELKNECLTFVYRLLFLFYAESREDLEILPVKDSVYQKGYSLEMLRDLEMVPLTTDSSRDGHFFSDSLWKLFSYLHKGQENENGFTLKPLDSPLFDNDDLIHLNGVRFRNYILQEIIVRLSLSERTKKKGRGRISYANLGINQLGSVYESLLAYSGFFAAETLIEVKSAKDNDGKDGTYLVPKTRRDDFTEDEILKDPEQPERDVEIPKGSFVYRLNGRDRKKTASYYTPEVLTQTTVKYTLKGILDKLKDKQERGEECADEILQLKILEPAMGAAAFQNEVINQLAVAYLELKENEVVKKGGKRIIPGDYRDEIQKVKAYIASHNVYGVDLNPTAIELGKLSLWLNCMHKDMETPFFAHRLGVGNAVVGAWLKVYDPKDFIVEFPSTGTTKQRKTPVPKDWWNKSPKRVSWKNGKLDRKEDSIYHFLLPDEKMVPSGNVKILKEELSDAELKVFTSWKKEFKSPISGNEHLRLKKICSVIDVLFEEHYRQTLKINQETTSHYNLYGQPEPSLSLKRYKEKERLAGIRNERSAPYYKLKTIMDYWTSIWFWDIRKIKDLPTREQWYNEVESILGFDINKLSDSSITSTQKTGFEDPRPEQTDLFGSTKQLKIGGARLKSPSQREQIKQLIAEYSSDISSLYIHDRIKYVQKLSEDYRFFHNELEFSEVFIENNGFDVIAGNPPWVGIEINDSDIFSEIKPEVSIRSHSSPEIRIMIQDYIKIDANFKKTFIQELIWAESTKDFIGSIGNYNLLDKQRNNLYKCILVNSLSLIQSSGYLGLLHPEGVYNDPNGQVLRNELYKRLSFHFVFKNGLFLFKEIHDQLSFSINVYSSSKEQPDFYSISNLFHPSTIDLSFHFQGNERPEGIKIFDKTQQQYTWNLRPHKDRIIRITQRELLILSKVFEDSEDYLDVKLVSLHTTQVLEVLNKLSTFNGRVKNTKYFATDGWNETTAVKSGIIKRVTIDPDINQYELIYSGPHFFVSNPLYKTPKRKCRLSSDYDTIDLIQITEKYVPRTNFIPAESKEKFTNHFLVDEKGPKWIDRYKVGLAEMVNIAGERTLQPFIIPPKVSHLGTIRSVVFKNDYQMIEFCGILSSLVLDFFIKTIGRGHIKPSDIEDLIIGIDEKHLNSILLRTLILNCLNDNYKDLWKSSWKEEFKEDNWSKIDPRLKSYDFLNIKWNWNTPLRNWFERRYALVEIDVIIAQTLKLSLDELILLYKIQFPVLTQNEDDTWYDQKGNIVFTCSKGLTGVGLDRNVWESITKQVNPIQRTLIDGDTYDHTITKSELYNGEKVTYYAPFDKCDRVEDYKTAWKHFEKIFAEK